MKSHLKHITLLSLFVIVAATSFIFAKNLQMISRRP